MLSAVVGTAFVPADVEVVLPADFMRRSKKNAAAAATRSTTGFGTPPILPDSSEEVLAGIVYSPTA